MPHTAWSSLRMQAATFIARFALGSQLEECLSVVLSTDHMLSTRTPWTLKIYNRSYNYTNLFEQKPATAHSNFSLRPTRTKRTWMCSFADNINILYKPHVFLVPGNKSASARTSSRIAQTQHTHSIRYTWTWGLVHINEAYMEIEVFAKPTCILQFTNIL